MDEQLPPPPRGINVFSGQWRDWLFRLYKYVFGNMNKDFFFEVARGAVSGHTAVNIASYSDDVSTTIKTVGQFGSGQQYVYPTAATIDYISSNNASDIYELTIVGLDNDFNQVTQTKTLTGQTPVAIDTPLRRVNFFYNNTATPTVGIVFLWDSPSGNGTEHTAGVPSVNSTVKAHISSSTSNGSDETSLSSVYTVPAGKTGYVVFGKTTVSDNKALELSFWVKQNGNVPRIAHHIELKDNNYDYFFKLPGKVPEKSDIEAKANIDVGTGECAAYYDIILVDN